MTVMGMLAVRVTSGGCPGASHHDITVIAERISHATVMARVDWAVPGVVVVNRSPHHVEQAEDDDPQQVDHVPVGRTRLNHRHAWSERVAVPDSTARPSEFSHHDSHDQQPQRHVEQVHAGEHVIEVEELLGRGAAQRDPCVASLHHS